MENENLTEENKEKKKIKTNLKEIVKKKEIWISGIVGLILGAVLIYVLGILGIPGLGHETIISFKGGKVTKNEAYNEMNKYYPITYMLELADKSILDGMYKLTDEQNKEINEQVDSILNMYQTYYGYTEEQFLEENGFKTKDEFIDYMQLDYKRNLYCIDYFKTLIPEEDINNYYNDNVYGKINTKHILVQVSDDTTDKQALATANEILAKLKEGKSFDDVANEYKDKVKTENVDFDNFTESSLAENYVKASKELEKDEYTTEAVKTDYGYHIIYCIDKADKPSLESVENDIVELLGKDLEAKDQYIRYKALIKLREDKNMKFKNKDLEEEYKEYCNQVNVDENTTATNTTADTTEDNNTTTDTTTDNNTTTNNVTNTATTE